MMAKADISHIKAGLMGLAYGEALSWSSMAERSHGLPPWLTRIRHELEKESRDEHISSIVKPFSLNQSPLPLKPCPGDLTEWTAWTGQLLIKSKGMLSQRILHTAWQELANTEEPVRGRISIQAALRNIQNGMTSPQSGRFNPHYFDDAALGRAALIGMANLGNTRQARKQAELDASFTHYEDGIWSASAIAALFSTNFTQVSIDAVLTAVVDDLPEGSMSKSTALAALSNMDDTLVGVMGTATYINDNVVNQIYSYGNVAHEILACILVILKAFQGDYDKTLACAAMVPSPGAGLLALSSALAAVIAPGNIQFPIHDHDQFCILRGLSLRSLRGLDLLHMAAELEKMISNPMNSDRKKREDQS